MALLTWAVDVVREMPLAMLIVFLIAVFIVVFALMKLLLRAITRATKRFRGSGGGLANDALIRFHLYGDERDPQRLNAENIWRWFCLKIVNINIGEDTTVERETRNTIFFLTFERPVLVGTLEVSSSDISLPSYEVKDLSNRTAIIAFAGGLPMGTLELRVRQ